MAVSVAFAVPVGAFLTGVVTDLGVARAVDDMAGSSAAIVSPSKAQRQDRDGLLGATWWSVAR